MKNRDQLVSYFNKGIIRKKNLLGISLLKKYILKRQACKLIKVLDFNSGNEADDSKKELLNISLNPYIGNSTVCHEIISYLDDNLSGDLAGAVVHGSLGNGDEINYSDFDGLVIIKNEVFTDADRMAHVAAKLSGTKKIIYAFDPLQHHDWFVLTEYDLEQYPETYFPYELFSQAKSLSREELKLKIKIPCQVQDHCRQFAGLAKRILNRIQSRTPRNVYQLKGFLSECMLLPALYIQCRTGKGIFKKLSFAAARVDFSPEVWQVMDEISAIRKNWTVSFNRLQYFLLSSSNPLLREMGKKIAPKIPEPLRSKLDKSFYTRIEKLVLAMRAKTKNEN